MENQKETVNNKECPHCGAISEWTKEQFQYSPVPCPVCKKMVRLMWNAATDQVSPDTRNGISIESPGAVEYIQIQHEQSTMEAVDRYMNPEVEEIEKALATLKQYTRLSKRDLEAIRVSMVGQGNLVPVPKNVGYLEGYESQWEPPMYPDSTGYIGIRHPGRHVHRKVWSRYL